MATYTYTPSGSNIVFKLSDRNIPQIQTGGLINAYKYDVDDENHTISPIMSVVNAIDIAWTNAYLSNFNKSVNTSGDVLDILNNIGGSLNNVNTTIENVQERLQALEESVPTGDPGQNNLIDKIIINDYELPIDENKAAKLNIVVNDKLVEVDSETNTLSINTNVDALTLMSVVSDMMDANPERFKGESAYQIAKRIVEESGGTFNVTEAQWIASLKGDEGPQGQQGEAGMSAYDIYRRNGGDLSEADWLLSLMGPTGPEGLQGEPGESAYQIAKRTYEENHQDSFPYETEADWIAAITPTGEGVTYAAGYGIDITNNVISSTNKWIILNEGDNTQD